jgi:hypothetical protein
MHLDVSSATMLVLRFWVSYSITVVRSSSCIALSIIGALPIDLSAVDSFQPTDYPQDMLMSPCGPSVTPSGRLFKQSS